MEHIAGFLMWRVRLALASAQAGLQISTLSNMKTDYFSLISIYGRTKSAYKNPIKSAFLREQDLIAQVYLDSSSTPPAYIK